MVPDWDVMWGLEDAFYNWQKWSTSKKGSRSGICDFHLRLALRGVFGTREIVDPTLAPRENRSLVLANISTEKAKLLTVYQPSDAAIFAWGCLIANGNLHNR
jgi:hypothetical protein